MATWIPPGKPGGGPDGGYVDRTGHLCNFGPPEQDHRNPYPPNPHRASHGMGAFGEGCPDPDCQAFYGGRDLHTVTADCSPYRLQVVVTEELSPAVQRYDVAGSWPATVVVFATAEELERIRVRLDNVTVKIVQGVGAQAD